MHEITFCGRVSVTEANTLRNERKESESADLHMIANSAIKEVRETLIRNLPSLPLHHREIINNILSL